MTSVFHGEPSSYREDEAPLSAWEAYQFELAEEGDPAEGGEGEGREGKEAGEGTGREEGGTGAVHTLVVPSSEESVGGDGDDDDDDDRPPSAWELAVRAVEKRERAGFLGKGTTGGRGREGPARKGRRGGGKRRTDKGQSGWVGEYVTRLRACTRAASQSLSPENEDQVYESYEHPGTETDPDDWLAFSAPVALDVEGATGRRASASERSADAPEEALDAGEAIGRRASTSECSADLSEEWRRLEERTRRQKGFWPSRRRKNSTTGTKGKKRKGEWSKARGRNMSAEDTEEKNRKIREYRRNERKKLGGKYLERALRAEERERKRDEERRRQMELLHSEKEGGDNAELKMSAVEVELKHLEEGVKREKKEAAEMHHDYRFTDMPDEHSNGIRQGGDPGKRGKRKAGANDREGERAESIGRPEGGGRGAPPSGSPAKEQEEDDGQGDASHAHSSDGQGLSGRAGPTEAEGPNGNSDGAPNGTGGTKTPGGDPGNGKAPRAGSGQVNAPRVRPGRTVHYCRYSAADPAERAHQERVRRYLEAELARSAKAEAELARSAKAEAREGSKEWWRNMSADFKAWLRNMATDDKDEKKRRKRRELLRNKRKKLGGKFLERALRAEQRERERDEERRRLMELLDSEKGGDVTADMSDEHSNEKLDTDDWSRQAGKYGDDGNSLGWAGGAYQLKAAADLERERLRSRKKREDSKYTKEQRLRDAAASKRRYDSMSAQERKEYDRSRREESLRKKRRREECTKMEGEQSGSLAEQNEYDRVKKSDMHSGEKQKSNDNGKKPYGNDSGPLQSRNNPTAKKGAAADERVISIGVSRGRLGLGVMFRAVGVIVTSVDPASALKNWVAVGDRLVSIDGRPLLSPGDLAGPSPPTTKGGERILKVAKRISTAGSGGGASAWTAPEADRRSYPKEEDEASCAPMTPTTGCPGNIRRYHYREKPDELNAKEESADDEKLDTRNDDHCSPLAWKASQSEVTTKAAAARERERLNREKWRALVSNTLEKKQQRVDKKSDEKPNMHNHNHRSSSAWKASQSEVITESVAVRERERLDREKWHALVNNTLTTGNRTDEEPVEKTDTRNDDHHSPLAWNVYQSQVAAKTATARERERQHREKWQRSCMPLWGGITIRRIHKAAEEVPTKRGGEDCVWETGRTVKLAPAVAATKEFKPN